MGGRKIISHTNRDILIQIAQLYYVEGLSQEEISKQMSISRSSVSRMLKTCLEEKIVEIKINTTNSMGMYLRNSIRQKFGLKEVIIVPAGFNQEETIISIGKAAGEYLESQLDDGMLLGVSWGTTTYYAVKAFNPSKNINVDVVQLLGGTNSRDIRTDGLELTTDIAAKLSGKCYVFHAPLLVQNKLLRDMLLQEPDIAKHFEKFAKIDTALVGVGSSSSGADALSRAGYITPEQSDKLESMGVVGNVCGNHIDINGNLCDVDLNERTIGISLDELKKIPNVIGIAAGPEKVKPILASLRGRIIKSLVTDEVTAATLLAMSN